MEEIRGEYLYRVDEYGFPVDKVTVRFRGDEILDEVDDDIIQSIMTEGLLRPRWNGEEWIEDMSPEEIEEAYRRPNDEVPLELRNRADIDYILIMMEV